jgi:[acyl-carrier-protein] S-malonyltransferase
MSNVWLFPGQGAQAVGMGRDLADAYPVARDLFAQADDILGFPLSEICFSGPEEELRRTAITQPALLTCSVAAARVLSAGQEAQPAAVAGHSLGEYSALVTAGSLNFADAVRLVHLRGQAMQEAVPEGQGAMAAILGLDQEAVSRVCMAVAEGQVVQPANLNAPGQIVIAGHAGAVDRALVALKEEGARRAVPLKVSAPFHCSLMAPAARRLAEALADVPMADARLPVWTNVDARPVTDGAELKEALVRQVDSPVRWEETLVEMGKSGHNAFLEVGPGSVLAGLVRRTLKGAQTRPAGSAAAVAELVAGTP